MKDREGGVLSAVGLKWKGSRNYLSITTIAAALQGSELAASASEACCVFTATQSWSATLRTKK